MEIPKGSLASSRVETCKSTFLSGCQSLSGFLTPAIMFGVDPRGDCRVSAWESVFSGVIWTSRSFGMVARPLEFLSSFKLRPPHLEV